MHFSTQTVGMKLYNPKGWGEFLIESCPFKPKRWGVSG